VAASVAALTVYDMCKALDKGIEFAKSCSTVNLAERAETTSVAVKRPSPSHAE